MFLQEVGWQPFSGAVTDDFLQCSTTVQMWYFLGCIKYEGLRFPDREHFFHFACTKNLSSHRFDESGERNKRSKLFCAERNTEKARYKSCLPSHLHSPGQSPSEVAAVVCLWVLKSHKNDGMQLPSSVIWRAVSDGHWRAKIIIILTRIWVFSKAEFILKKWKLKMSRNKVVIFQINQSDWSRLEAGRVNTIPAFLVIVQLFCPHTCCENWGN